MESLTILTSAINQKRVITYEFHKEGEDRGLRIGHAYAIFIFTSKVGLQSTKVHIVQTSGVSKSIGDNPFPSFRMYNLEHLKNINILTDTFSPPFHEKYNSEWEGYKDIFAKV